MRIVRFGLVMAASAAIAFSPAVFAKKSKQALPPPPADEAVYVTDMPAPDRGDFRATARPYLIGPFDKLRIDVFGVEELQRDVQVDSSGQFSMPLVGTMTAAGKTAEEIASDIRQALVGRYVRNPQVTVNVQEAVSQLMTIDGQVDKPGLYPVIGEMSLLRSVATAGGTNEFAKLDDVVIFRTVNGKRYAGIYNLKAIRRGIYPDPEVFANDVIVVGDSKSRRLLDNVIKAAPLLSTPLILLFNN